MRENRLRIGMEVEQKVSGTKFLVTKITRDEDGSKVAEAVEVIPASETLLSEKTPKKVTISKANDICYKITYDPGPTEPVTGYTLKDGTIYYNDNPIEQGEIVVDEILALLPGGLVVTVKAAEESFVNVYFYNVERDLFELKFTDIPKEEIVVFKVTENEMYFGFNRIITSIEKDEDGQEKEVRKFGHAFIFKIAYGKQCSVCIHGNPLLFDQAAFKDTFLYIPYEECGSVEKPIEKCDRGYYIFDVETTLRYVFQVTSKTAPVCTYTHYCDNLIVKTDNELYIDGYLELRTEKVKLLSDYPYLVDVTPRSKYETTYSFTDKECTKVITITKTSTKDRGVIYKSSLE